MSPGALPRRHGVRGAALAALAGLLLCTLPAGVRAQQVRLNFQERGDEAFLAPQAVHTNTEFTGTPGVLQVRQWSPDERAAFPNLTGNTLRMRLDEAAAVPGNTLQCLPATPGLTPLLEGLGASDARNVTGVLGNGLDLPPGRNTHVRLVSGGVDLASNAGAMTLMTWLRPDTQLDTASFADVINVGGSGGTRLGFSIRGGDGLRAWAEAPDAAVDPLTTSIQVPWAPGVWRLVATVFELSPANRVSFYLDGRLLGVSPMPFSAAATSAALSDRAALGSNEAYSGSYFEGALDEPSIWKRALPAEEIRRLWRRQSGPYGGGEPSLFVSRVLDSGGPRVRWDTLGWKPRAPAGKGLPDEGITETGYTESNVSMADNVLLLHADGTGALVDGATVPDASGRGHAATFTAPDGIPGGYVQGRVGEGLALPRQGYLTVGGDAAPDFAFARGDFTWAAWVKTTSCQGNNLVVMGAEGSSGNPHVWMGGGCEALCPDGRGWWVVRDSTGDFASVCHPIRLDDGEWHHLVGVKQGRNPVTLTLYVDGEPLSVTHDYAGDFSFDQRPLLGQFPGMGFPTEAAVDEVAIWRRALSAQEARDVWRRGGTRLKLQVRTCDEPGCAGVPFVGPDGTAATFFSEATHGSDDRPPDLGPLGQAGARPGRYIQYAVTLETDSSRDTPGLTEVTVLGLNSAPIAMPDAYETASNKTLQVEAPGVLGNDVDDEGGPLHALLLVGPIRGTLQLGEDGSFQYTPDPGFTGTDRFRYRASDGALDSVQVEVVLTVSAMPGAPRIERPAANEVLHTRTPEFEGTADPGIEVELVVDDTVLGRTTAGAQGRWRYAVTPEQALTMGGHRAVAYAVGVTQLRSAPSNEVPFVIQPRELDVTGCGCGGTGGGHAAVGLAWLALMAWMPARVRRARHTR
ncbi:LamG-like jellyroll fold domain-containing protein [Myxococcus sp. RHSTA-1-4]|uniref:LamG-like jellyroll fold domain-containing protein n=1 Tax=Myxococcus sp. RHSTA-1-4 TaxID=2874601 RepID=UPI001CC0F785|nr:LamG-like jellyroll fold domain-containing protein [Myxococcus sp. RHSTA-1-4]MBZ4416791.1 cadherin-like domain-containing protein [Myxococcus sp. RHSTA-1-4]